MRAVGIIPATPYGVIVRSAWLIEIFEHPARFPLHPFPLDSLSMGMDASLELIVRPQRLVEK